MVATRPDLDNAMTVAVMHPKLGSAMIEVAATHPKLDNAMKVAATHPKLGTTMIESGGNTP